MIHYSKVMAGLHRYLNEDLVSKFRGTGWGWVLGGLLELAMMNAHRIYEWATTKPIVKMCGYVDGEAVDVETLYTVFLAQAKLSNAVIPIPCIGPRTYTASDIEKLYKYIKEA